MNRAILLTALLCACGSKAPVPEPAPATPGPVDTTPTLDRGLPAVTADGSNVVVVAGATLLVKDRADATVHEHDAANADEANGYLARAHAERDLHPLDAVTPGGSFDVRFNEGRVIVMSGGSPLHDRSYKAWTKPPAETCQAPARFDAAWADASRKVALLRITFEPAADCTRFHVVAW